jgi:hypothetical protein
MRRFGATNEKAKQQLETITEHKTKLQWTNDTNLERKGQATKQAAAKQKRANKSQAITEWLKRQEEEDEQENDKAEGQQGGGGERRRTNGESESEKKTQPAQPARTATPKRGPPTPPPASGGGPAGGALLLLTPRGIAPPHTALTLTTVTDKILLIIDENKLVTRYG